MDLDKKMKRTATEILAVLSKSELSIGEGLATLAMTLVIASRVKGLTDADIQQRVVNTIDSMNATKQ
jgi:hypothetical protein